MTYYEISRYSEVHEVKNEELLADLISSIETHGWKADQPLLVHDELGSFINGSHRIAALRAIEAKYNGGEYSEDEEDAIYNLLNEVEVAEDVGDLVNKYIEENEIGDFYGLPFDSIGSIFYETWIEEQYPNLCDEPNW